LGEHGRASTLATCYRADARNHGAHTVPKECTKSVTTARTVCLLARRQLKEGSADVLPVRQSN